MDGSTAAAKPKAKLKANKKEEKDKNPKGKLGKGKGKEVVLNYAKFEGQGLNYKAKLFGFVEVPGPRGDQSSVQAIQKLKQQAKQLKKGANEHKLKITFNITLQGVRLFNEKTQSIEHEHPIQKISFISHDPEDRHVFGYIYSPPRSAANEARKYYLFAIKSDKSADVITVQLYELFQVVYKMQENRKMQGKDKQRQHDKSSKPLEPLQDKMLLEMSNKIGGDQQPYPADEHLYAEPVFVKRTPSEATSDYAIPTDQPLQSPSVSENHEYQVPRSEDEVISERERADIATAIALSLSMQENSQPFSDSVSTPTASDDPGFEAISDSTVSFPTEETSNQNAFHAEFPPFENGFTSPDDSKFADFSESSKDSGKFNIPGADEMQTPPSKQTSFNAFGDLSSTADVKTNFETSQNENENVNIDNEVISFPEPSNEATASESKETEDINYNSTKTEFEPVKGVVKDLPPSNPPAENISSFESDNDNSANDVETETSTTIGTSTKTSFEVNFDIENEDENKQTQQDMFPFDASSDVFSSHDPFASTGSTEFDQSAFNAFADDPFCPNSGNNVDTKSDPFAENDSPFTSSFSDVHTNDFEQIPNETNSENDQNGNREEDIFEAIFEAKMEGQFENNTSSKDENKKEEINSIPQNQDEFDLEKPSHDSNAELDNQEKEITETPEEYQTPMTLLNINTTEPVEDVTVLNDSPAANNEVLEDQLDETECSKDDNVNEENAFDFSSNDVYVTLKTAVPSNNRAHSPNEFSPPPLPPRPLIPKEPIDTVGSPKIPPALPPRPTINQPEHTETTVRKPPELPPRLDLEENDLVENEFPDVIEEPESFPNDTGSPMFEANFDTFDFDNIGNNSSVGNIGTPTSGFSSSDPFKDPFAGADPFQTPIAGDPFASSTSFTRDVQQDSDDFDPFSGDDPFAMTPAFDTQASFNSPLNTNMPSSDEPNNDEEKDKFADFSAFA